MTRPASSSGDLVRPIEEVVVDQALADAMARLINQAFSIEAFFVDGDRITAAEILRLADKPQAQFFVTRRAGRVVGCIFAEVRGGGVGYFGLLAADPDQRGSGIGHQLIERVERFLQERGCHTIEITVVDRREELFPYYERRGFVRDGRTDAFPREARMPCALIYMSKRLALR